ncbi:MAG: MBL fold metallo-hydrolase [Candidatus Limnocylindrales bacterium]
MEITWYGGSCIRLRGKEGVVAADAYRSIVGLTGRGLTADIVTYSHADPRPLPLKGKAKGKDPAPDGVVRPTSLEPSFQLDRPGEYEVHQVLISGVRAYRDEQKGAENGDNVIFVYELDGLHTVHLGDIGHALTESMIGEIGPVEVVVVPVGGHLSAARAAALVAQLDANLVVPIPVCEEETACEAEMAKFRHEMGVQQAPEPQPKLSVTISSVPQELTLIVLESKSRT